MRIYGIVGAGGFGREVMPVAREMLSRTCDDKFKMVFVDDGIGVKDVNGVEVLTVAEFIALKSDGKFFNVAIGNSKVRESVAVSMVANGINHFDIHALNSMVLDGNQIGDGSVICPFSMVTSNSIIGRFFQANIYSYVAHDCVIGDFVTFAPSVKCNGNVHIEDHVYIGTGAIIKQGTPGRPIVIGEGAIVGMGAVVNKSVPAGAVVVGNPAKPLRQIKGPSHE